MKVVVILVIFHLLYLDGGVAIICHHPCPLIPLTQLNDFKKSLTGPTLSPADVGYANASLMQNRRVTEHPGLIVYALDASDVQKTVVFSKKHSLKLAVQSTGHSYVGRSTVEGGILLILSKLKQIKVELNSTRSPHGEVMVETGNMWGGVYEEVDKYGRVVVGGSDPSVGMGGYTQGGGHSPICRSLGLAVDNLLEVKLIIADGGTVTTSTSGTTIKHTNGTVINSNDADLFWALRGGGGGTWGVVLSFTFKLHLPPNNGMMTAISVFNMYELNSGFIAPGAAVLKKYFEFLKTVDEKWGGYALYSTMPLDNTHFGTLTLDLVYFGGWTQAVQNKMDAFMATLTTKPVYTALKKYTSFWEYQKNVPADRGGARIYLYNSLLQNDTDYDSLVDTLVQHAVTKPYPLLQGCTNTFIGGATRQGSEKETSISVGFRTATHSLSCFLGWGDPKYDADGEKFGLRFGDELQKYGKAVYFNEPTEDISDWKEATWGKDNYARLLTIKKKWDPEQLFWCHHCVGSDLPRKQYCPVCIFDDKSLVG
ncbi:hypothetical protein LOTGIDRAFT_239224 [Lottia gigantea]|uniref:FAD-binding PCMH-type domain-containing protein n=1 Tax=Lottia gigantea TaxID=225164 RepID=V4C5Z8_LOTGI|nr:hypothetical protein LOTGIDRAFT_239224 [Lottia gigantea]ESO97044.1 hypothetical protein LOTGIDRAFT_239224 [Lottia gigantea]